MAAISDDTGLIVRGVLRLGRRLRSERPQSTVSLSALGMLSTLHRLGAMPAARLAEQERLKPQSLSRLITQLESAGLIERSPGEVDRRTLILKITAAGRRALSHDMVARRAWLAATMARALTAADRALLAEAAQVMLRLADDGSPQQPGVDDDE